MSPILHPRQPRPPPPPPSSAVQRTLLQLSPQLPGSMLSHSGLAAAPAQTTAAEAVRVTHRPPSRLASWPGPPPQLTEGQALLSKPARNVQLPAGCLRPLPPPRASNPPPLAQPS